MAFEVIQVKVDPQLGLIISVVIFLSGPSTEDCSASRTIEGSCASECACFGRRYAPADSLESDQVQSRLLVSS